MKLNWKYISLFLILAIGISAPIHLGYFDKPFQSFFNDSIIKDWGYLIAGIGPLTAGLIVLFLDKSVSNRITILGDDPLKYFLIALLPVLIFPIFGLDNPYGINKHYYAFIYALINVVYAFFEEYGWRRYLQNALEGLNKHWKYILIGMIWWIWHIRFESTIDLFVFPLICIGGGYLLGKLTDDTGSIVPVVLIHTISIILTNSGTVTTNKWIGVVLSILAWIIIERIWSRKKRMGQKLIDGK